MAKGIFCIVPLGTAVTLLFQLVVIGTEKLSLKYEHKKNPESTTKKTNEVQDILEKLSAEVGVKPDNARLFTKLIFAVRRLNMKGMQVVWYRQYECLERQSPCTKEQSKKKQ